MSWIRRAGPSSLVCFLVVAAGCSGSSPPQPTPVFAPPPAAAPPPAPPLITCPADVRTESLDGRPVPASYNLPNTAGGTGPVAVACSPAPGTPLTVGTTTVDCTATDAASLTATCSFSIAVLPPPRLSHTQFLAFGDSLTLGVTSPAATVLTLMPSESYPYKLRNHLAARYRTQSIGMINVGVGGEEASDGGLQRFSHELRQYRPDVVLLMEGTNDLFASEEAGIGRASRALADMVRDAGDRGVRLFLATIPPQRPGGPRDRVARLVPRLNDEIRHLAAQRGVPLVDVYAAMERDLSLIGRDDLHPTEAGYDVIARAFAEVIQKVLEAPPSGLRSLVDRRVTVRD